MLVLRPNAYNLLVRPLLFAMPPETAQSVADSALKREGLWRALSRVLRVQDPRLKVYFSDRWLSNPIGLAAGYDKNCELLPSLAALGFGYIVGGTVRQDPQPGNLRPRVLRYTRDQSLVNALGFPTKGLDYVAGQLEKHEGRYGDAFVVVSVAGVTLDEFKTCHSRIEPLASAVELNISSPNTSGLRAFQEPQALADLLGNINEARKKPLFVKLPSYGFTDTSEARERVLTLAKVCMDSGVTALTVANTWPVRDSRLEVGSGGLSGKAIFPDMLRMVAEVRSAVGSRVAINACGGVFTGEDAWKAMQAGATTVQLLTGLVYRGPGIVRQMSKELLEVMDANGVPFLPS